MKSNSDLYEEKNTPLLAEYETRGFRLEVYEDRIRIALGLPFSRDEQTIPLAKIKRVIWYADKLRIVTVTGLYHRYEGLGTKAGRVHSLIQGALERYNRVRAKGSDRGIARVNEPGETSSNKSDISGEAAASLAANGRSPSPEEEHELGLVCPRCSTLNRGTAKYCRNCGEPVASAGSNPSIMSTTDTEQTTMRDHSSTLYSVDGNGHEAGRQTITANARSTGQALTRNACHNGQLANQSKPRPLLISGVAYDILRWEAQPLALDELVRQVQEIKDVLPNTVRAMIRIDPRFWVSGKQVGLVEWKTSARLEQPSHAEVKDEGRAQTEDASDSEPKGENSADQTTKEAPAANHKLEQKEGRQTGEINRTLNKWEVRDIVAVILAQVGGPLATEALHQEARARGLNIPWGELLNVILADDHARFERTGNLWVLRSGVAVRRESATAHPEAVTSPDDEAIETAGAAAGTKQEQETAPEERHQGKREAKAVPENEMTTGSGTGAAGEEFIDEYLGIDSAAVGISIDEYLGIEPEGAAVVGVSIDEYLGIDSVVGGVSIDEFLGIEPEGAEDVTPDAQDIELLDLPLRTRNALYRGNIRTIGQLQRYMREPGLLLELRGVGTGMLGEVENALRKYDEVGPPERAHTSVDPAIADPGAELSNSRRATLKEALHLEGILKERFPLEILDEDLGPRVYNALYRAGVSEINQLLQIRQEDLGDIRGIGPGGIHIIHTALQKLWIRLSDDAVASEEGPLQDVVGELPRDEGERETITAQVGKDPAGEPITESEIAAVRDLLIPLQLQEQIRRLGIAVDQIPIQHTVARNATAVLGRGGLATLGELFVEVARSAYLLPIATGVIDRLKFGLSGYLEQLCERRRQIDGLGDARAEGEPRIRLVDVVALLFVALDERAAEITLLRHGLRDGQKWTLEEVANVMSVTRERIRQIETRAEKTTRDAVQRGHRLTKLLSTLLEPQLETRAGLATREEICTGLVSTDAVGSASPSACLEFLLERIPVLAIVAPGIYALRSVEIKTVRSEIAWLRQKIVEELWRVQTQIEFSVLVKTLSSQLWQDHQSAADRLVELAILSDPALLIRDDGMVGLQKWEKHWVDELIRAMRHLGRPVHFSRAAQATNALLPPDKHVSAHNVHSMMLRRSDLFVRTGNGKYGLAEWGLKQERTIADAACRILREAREPLTTRQLTDRVLEERHVRPTSVLVMITQDPRFCRSGPKWGLCEWADEKHDETEDRDVAPNVDPDLEDLIDLLLGD